MRIFLLTFLLLLLAFSISAQVLKPGSPAPLFSVVGLDSSVRDLSAMRGKVVLVTFWSTRCAICHSEIPRMNAVKKSFDGQNVVFMAISTESEDRIVPYLKKNAFDFTIVPNGFGTLAEYADKGANGSISMGFPSYFLIDRAGKIAYRSSGWDKTPELSRKISSLLVNDQSR